MGTVEQLVGSCVARSAAVDLRRYKLYGDSRARSGVWAAGLSILIGIGIEEGWAHSVDDDNRPRGLLTECVNVVIEDICGLNQPMPLTAIGWSIRLGLKSPEQWSGKWSNRYQALKACFQELIVMGVDAQ